MKKLLAQATLAAITLILTANLLKAADEGWTTDYKQALSQAKAEKKLVVLDFTGSDWCSWCIKLKKEVFTQPRFKSYAAKKLVLVEVDFPQEKQQSDEVKKQNAELQEKFHIEVFPSIIVLNSDGKKIGEFNYIPGGPEAFLAEIRRLPKI